MLRELEKPDISLVIKIMFKWTQIALNICSGALCPCVGNDLSESFQRVQLLNGDVSF